MSTTTLKLPYKRFIAQVSTGAPRSKSTYLALMAENLTALQSCPWREAADMPASLTGHDFTAQTQFSDAYDAFKLTGNYNSNNMTEVAYAGMAAYRFTIPASAISGSVPVTSVSLPITRDRYEKSGVHLAVAISASATPSTDWATVRGTGDLAASAQLAQTTAANLMAGAPGEGTVTIDLSGVPSGNPAAYLWVYVTLEDYTDHWTMYNAREKRLYAIEGSAMLAGGSADITFGASVETDDMSGGSIKYLANPIPVRLTHVEDWHRTLRPRVCVSLLSVAKGYAPITSESVNSLPVKSILLPVATWTINGDTYDFPIEHLLPTDGMRIPEGNYIIEAWIDESGDGKFIPGEPYGCARAYDLASDASPDTIGIELMEVHPSMPRIDLEKMIDGMPATSAADASTPHPVSDSVAKQLAAATDRGRWGLTWATVEPSDYPGSKEDYANTRLTRVRIVRSKISSSSHMAVLFDHYFELSVRSVMTEADLLADGLLDLDWGTLTLAWTGTPNSLTSATYRLVVGNVDVGEDDDGCTQNIPLVFVNRFETGTKQSKTTPDSSLVNKVYAGSPTFRWSHTSPIDKPYLEFRLHVYADENKTTKVYDSQVQEAPARDASGMYEWTAPIQAGVTTDEGATLAEGTTYYWAVSMLDSKYTTFSSVEDVTPFSFGT